ncbi:hypothetical protein CCS92_34350, partial [Methylobacterium radiotolerans]
VQVASGPAREQPSPSPQALTQPMLLHGQLRLVLGFAATVLPWHLLGSHTGTELDSDRDASGVTSMFRV